MTLRFRVHCRLVEQIIKMNTYVFSNAQNNLRLLMNSWFCTFNFLGMILPAFRNNIFDLTAVYFK